MTELKEMPKTFDFKEAEARLYKWWEDNGWFKPEIAGPDAGRVIDVSGDGTPNAGRDVRPVVAAAERQGVTINGIAKGDALKAQVRQLLALFTFSDEKIEAAVVLYPRVVDAEAVGLGDRAVSRNRVADALHHREGASRLLGVAVVAEGHEAAAGQPVGQRGDAGLEGEKKADADEHDGGELRAPTGGAADVLKGQVQRLGRVGGLDRQFGHPPRRKTGLRRYRPRYLLRRCTGRRGGVQ